MGNSERTFRIYDINAGSPEVPKNFLSGYIRGNAIWPQKHFVTSVFVAQQALAEGRAFSELAECQFSVEQLDTIVGAMNHSHRANGVGRVFPGSEVDVNERSISIEEITYLWERSVFGAASRVIAIAKLIPTLQPLLVEFSNLRDPYYRNRREAIQVLQRLDQLMDCNKSEFSVVSQVLDRMKHHMTQNEMRSLAAKYRNMIITYQREGGDGQSEYSLLKDDIVDEATGALVDILKNDFPDVDWSNFDSSY
jgi:hypothetical protein